MTQTLANSIEEKTIGTLSTKAVTILFTILLALLSYIYGLTINKLEAEDQTQKKDIAIIQLDHKAYAQEMDNVSSNIYLLCQSNSVRCIPPKD